MLKHLCAAIAAATFVTAADPPKKGEVTVAVTVADRPQPAGWPVVVEVKLTNTGAEPISWWSGGPDKYPAAEHFAVQVRYGSDSDWHDVKATNGQYTQGSGFGRALKSGESVTVPLAIPVKKADHVTVRVSPRTWHATKPAEESTNVSGEARVLDPYRAKLIAAAIQPSSPFQRHLAERYADSVVIDALTKLITVDNEPIVTGVAPILARQRELPADTGEALGNAVKRWLPRTPRPEWGGLREYVVEAALKTRSEPARKVVLDALREPPNADARWLVINALRLSSGDAAWLRRARTAIADAGQARPDDAELARQVKLATEWLDSRIKSGDK